MRRDEPDHPDSRIRPPAPRPRPDDADFDAVPASAEVAVAAERNPGGPLDPARVRSVWVDRRAVGRRVSRLAGRPAPRAGERVAWLLRTVALMDLTTLAGDDTPGWVRRLCATARRPLGPDLVAALGVAPEGLHVAAVCVHHALIGSALQALQGTTIPVAAVSAGFPHGLSPLAVRIAEVEASVAAGAAEIDIVIRRSHVLTGRWEALYDEVRAFREAAGPAHLKAILATGELGTLTNVARASLVCMMAGADFVKTSTGKEAVNATLPVGVTMLRAIRDFADRTGHAVGFKPAGGIRTADEALRWMALVDEELGAGWLAPSRFRFGASSLLGDVERELARLAAAPGGTRTGRAP